MTTTTMITFLQTDFDTYTAIFDHIYDLCMDDDADFDRDAIIAFAADLGVALTDWDITSCLIDIDEM